MADKRLSVALIGNPNAGKSTIFNLLTGLRQHVSNFPGITVDKKIGVFQTGSGEKVDLIDLPGIYSLFPNSKDEKLVVDIITDPTNSNYPDLVLYVADVNNLERHLLLSTQLLDLKIPMIIVLNMIDIAEANEQSIDADALQKELEVPVLTMSGKTGYQINELKNKIEKFISEGKDAFVKEEPFYSMTAGEKVLTDNVNAAIKSDQSYRSKILAHHHEWLSHLNAADRIQIKSIAGEAGFDNIKGQISETMNRYNKFGYLVKSTLNKPNLSSQSFTEKIDNIITHKIVGPIIFFAIMLLMFQSIYSWASFPMDLIDGFFGTAGYFVRGILPEGWFTNLIVDGIIAGLGGILIFIPQITILFFLIAVLEESGYMSRAVFMFDGLMQRFGLNGRSIVALVSSGACAIPAIMSTRTIGNRTERLITIMVSPLISCSARIPVYTVLIGFVVVPGSLGIFNTQGLAFMGLYMLGIIASLLVALVFKTLLPSDEEGSYLMMELPQYKRPIWKNVLHTVKEKVQAFVVEAGKVILVISVVLWFLASYGPGTQVQDAELEAISMSTQQGLEDTEKENLIAAKRIEASYAGHLGKFIEPAIAPLGFDWKIGIALLTSFAAREVFVGTMATIYSIGSSDDETSVTGQMLKERRPDGRLVYDFATSLSLLIFYVFALQCMSTIAVTKRETNSWKWPIIQFIYMGLMAYLGSLMVYQTFS
jgi:ferrous iron transport protein B